MKILMIVLSLFTTSAFASSICNESWEDVDRSAYNVDFPKVIFDSVWVSVNEVCRSGKDLRSVNKVEVCVVPGTGESSKCLKSELKLLYTPIEYIKLMPLKGESSDLEPVEQTHPMSYSVGVGYQRDSFQTVCKKTYKIQDC